jgi:hypothetical protein
MNTGTDLITLHGESIAICENRRKEKSYLMLNKCDIVMLTSWVIPPPAVSWHARPIMSIFMLVDIAQMILVTKYIPMMGRRMGLRP